MSVPTIPARPARSQNIDIPSIPPRPRRSMERSLSPHRDSYARSPLNDPSFMRSKPQGGLSNLSKSISREYPQRPPSVNLPSVGQEGEEYAHLEQNPSPPTVGSLEHKTIAGDLPLHAPKASLPVSTAKTRIQAVTRTDSDSAAALGIGKPRSEAGENNHSSSGLSRSLSRTPSAQQTSRPSSIFKSDSADVDEQGIPEIGMQIPLYKNAGDVQAPTPSSTQTPPATGIGFFNKGDVPQQKNHHRSQSGREVFTGPPGSYGLRGHGITKNDPFEKAWYTKHPEASAREAQGQYGPRIPMERKEYNLSSQELNNIVHAPSAEPHQVSTPDERIGYLASEEYASRMSSPRPASAAKPRSIRNGESPLRTMKTPSIKVDDSELSGNESDVIHVDRPRYALPAEGNTPGAGLGVSNDDEESILPADELALNPESRYQTPAIEIDLERRKSGEYLGESSSRSHSRSNSIQHNFSPVLSRDLSSTPLEDVREYEPLFSEDDEKRANKRPASVKSLGDHNDGPRHQFRSKDIWEDAPDSALYEAEVETPQEPAFSRPEAEHEPKELFESPESEQARKNNIQPAELDLRGMAAPKKTGLNKSVGSEKRPSVRHRFPSQDVWEDTPDSLMHTTELDDDEPSKDTPNVPARPSRLREETSATSPTESKKAPIIPDRPKPQVPARPSKSSTATSPEEAPLSRSISKEKPSVPAKSGIGSKIAALKGSFMTDLESRLRTGPQAIPKPQEKEAEEEAQEKAPLADARKGRAKGPARRKPAASPGAAESAPRPKVSFVSAVTVWQIDEDGNVSIGGQTSKPIVDEKVEEPNKVEPVEEQPEEEGPVETAEKTVQTGQIDIEVPKGTDGEDPEKATIYLGGRAPEKGTVVVKDGVEHVGDDDERGAIEKTAPVSESS